MVLCGRQYSQVPQALETAEVEALELLSRCEVFLTMWEELRAREARPENSSIYITRILDDSYHFGPF